MNKRWTSYHYTNLESSAHLLDHIVLGWELTDFFWCILFKIWIPQRQNSTKARWRWCKLINKQTGLRALFELSSVCPPCLCYHVFEKNTGMQIGRIQQVTRFKKTCYAFSSLSMCLIGELHIRRLSQHSLCCCL